MEPENAGQAKNEPVQSQEIGPAVLGMALELLRALHFMAQMAAPAVALWAREYCRAHGPKEPTREDRLAELEAALAELRRPKPGPADPTEAEIAEAARAATKGRWPGPKPPFKTL